MARNVDDRVQLDMVQLDGRIFPIITYTRGWPSTLVVQTTNAPIDAWLRGLATRDIAFERDNRREQVRAEVIEWFGGRLTLRLTECDLEVYFIEKLPRLTYAHQFRLLARRGSAERVVHATIGQMVWEQYEGYPYPEDVEASRVVQCATRKLEHITHEPDFFGETLNEAQLDLFQVDCNRWDPAKPAPRATGSFVTGYVLDRSAST